MILQRNGEGYNGLYILIYNHNVTTTPTMLGPIASIGRQVGFQDYFG